MQFQFIGSIGFTECVLFAVCSLPSIVKNVTGESKIYLFNLPMPLEYLLYLTLSLCVAVSWAKGPRRKTRFGLLPLILFGCLWMTILGAASGEELKWIVVDFFAFMGLFIGVLWANTKEAQGLIVVGYYLSIIYTLMLIFGVFFLIFGWTGHSAAKSNELVDQAILWGGLSGALTFLPLLYVVRDQWIHRSMFRIKSWVLFLVPVMFIPVVFLTRSRSSLVLGVLVGCCLLRIIMHKSLVNVFKFSLLGIVLVVLAIFFTIFHSDRHFYTFFESGLYNKFSTKTNTDEARFVEAMTIIDVVSDHKLTGLGFGSRYVNEFWKGIENFEDGLSHAPHWGALAFLQKGGYPVYIIFIVVPLCVSLCNFLFAVTRNEFLLAIWSQVLLYILLSSFTTGGWSFISTFFYGAFFSKAVQYQQQLRKHRLRSLTDGLHRPFRVGH